MKLNLPNKLTLIRLMLIPVFVALFINSFTFEIMIFEKYNLLRILSGLVFIIASITDFFDGQIARKYNLVTNFGKLMDPLADKTLVCTALICLTVYNYVPLWTVLIVIFREFLISGFRLVAVEQNVVIAASKWGKYKTATQMISISLLLFDVHKINHYLYIGVYFLYYVSVVLTIVSLLDYLYKNKNILVE